MAWPGAELKVIDDSGHTGSPTMQNAILEAISVDQLVGGVLPRARPGCPCWMWRGRGSPARVLTLRNPRRDLGCFAIDDALPRGMTTRRRFVVSVGLLGVGGLLAACSPASPTPAAPTAAP